jgi:hypothetical protein
MIALLKKKNDLKYDFLSGIYLPQVTQQALFILSKKIGVFASLFLLYDAEREPKPMQKFLLD